MTIRYDHQIFSLQRQGGISRYFAALLQGFEAQPLVSTECPVWGSKNQYWQDWKGPGPWWTKGNWKGQKDLGYLLNDAYDWLTAKKSQCQVYHPTYYSLAALTRIPHRPLVITVHDLTDEIYHRHLPQYQKILAQRAAHIQKADQIIVVSESTRQDLLLHYKVPIAKTALVYHGSNWSLDPTALDLTQRTDVPSPFLLYVGQRYGYKNFEGLCRSFAALKEKFPHWRLVCTGGKPFALSEQKLLAQLHLTQQVSWVAANSEADLKKLYQRAAALVYPSLYEGFGMPILEAFSQSCPVITAHASSTGEIAGDAAWLFGAQGSQDLTACLAAFMQDPAASNSLVEKGRERCAQFHWQKTCAETAAVYQKA